MEAKIQSKESILDFVRRVKLHRLLPVGTPRKIAQNLGKNDSTVRGVSKGQWTDLDILEATANELMRCGEVGQSLMEMVAEERLHVKIAA